MILKNSKVQNKKFKKLIKQTLEVYQNISSKHFIKKLRIKCEGETS